MALPTSLDSRKSDEHESRRCRTPGTSECQGCERRTQVVGLADGDADQPSYAARDAARDAARNADRDADRDAIRDAFPSERIVERRQGRARTRRRNGGEGGARL